MYTRTIQILGYLSTTGRVALYWSPLHKQCALTLHTLTSWIRVAGYHWNICFFRLFQCVGSNFVCRFIRDCQTLSVQDLSATSRCHLIHWGACTVMSHTCELALCRPRTGFCWQALEFWSILFHAIPTKKEKYVECVYNSIFCISEYVPDIFIHTHLHLGTDENRVVRSHYHAFDDLKGSPPICFWLHMF